MSHSNLPPRPGSNNTPPSLPKFGDGGKPKLPSGPGGPPKITEPQQPSRSSLPARPGNPNPSFPTAPTPPPAQAPTPPVQPQQPPAPQQAPAEPYVEPYQETYEEMPPQPPRDYNEKLEIEEPVDESYNDESTATNKMAEALREQQAREKIEDSYEETPTKKGAAKGKKSKKKPPQKKEKLHAYSGERRNVLLARIGIITVLGILCIAGINSFIPKGSGLTSSDGPLILSKVRENLNVTDFPLETGKAYAVAFTKQFLTIDPEKADQRVEALSNYIDPDILSNIDARPATASELADAGVATMEEIEKAGGTTTKQSVISGPYVIDAERYFGGETATITVMSQINSGKWVVLEVPLFYDITTHAMTVSGAPVFREGTTIAKIPDYEKKPNWSSDSKLEETIMPILDIYMRAWSESKADEMERVTLKQDGKNVATLEAMTGLNGAVHLLSIKELLVQQKEKPEEGADAQAREDYNNREAWITVEWLDKETRVVYTQTYSIDMVYTNNDWFVKDIRDVVSSVDRAAVNTYKAEEAAKED